MNIVNIEEGNLLNDLTNFNEISRKMLLSILLKGQQKHRLE